MAFSYERHGLCAPRTFSERQLHHRAPYLVAHPCGLGLYPGTPRCRPRSRTARQPRFWGSVYLALCLLRALPLLSLCLRKPLDGADRPEALESRWARTSGQLYRYPLFAGMYLFLYVRSLSFKLWRYILLDKFSGGLLTQDYFFQDWIRALLMAVVSLLTFAPLTTEALWATAGGVLLLVQLLGIIQVVRRLTQASTGFLFLFLYLCAHEVAPFLYIAGVTIYLSRGDLLLLNTFQ